MLNTKNGRIISAVIDRRLEFGFSLDKFQGLRSFGFSRVILLALSLVI
jgi:hypothetical protein